jgi:peroxisomal enoyl-CoA hydratase 2
MHGLFTYNCAAHAVLKCVGDNNPASLQEFRARFAAPVRAGDELVTKIWKLGEFEGQYEDVRFSTFVNGNIVLSNGRALVKPAVRSSKF